MSSSSTNRKVLFKDVLVSTLQGWCLFRTLCLHQFIRTRTFYAWCKRTSKVIHNRWIYDWCHLRKQQQMKNEPSWRCCKIIGRSFEKICNVTTFHIWSLKCLVAHDRLSDTCPSDDPISIALAIFIRIEINFEIKDRDGKFLSSSVMLALTTELR